MNIFDLIAFMFSVPPLIVGLLYMFYKSIVEEAKKTRRYINHLDFIETIISDKENKNV